MKYPEFKYLFAIILAASGGLVAGLSMTSKEKIDSIDKRDLNNDGVPEIIITRTNGEAEIYKEPIGLEGKCERFYIEEEIRNYEKLIEDKIKNLPNPSPSYSIRKD